MPEILHQFHFLRPVWFLALLPAALLLAGLWWRRLRQSGLERICDAELLPHLIVDKGNPATKRPLLLLAAAWLLAVTALAGPVWRRQPRPVYRLETSRVLVLDLSPSMAATDITPSRLARARYKISDILKRSREGRTGLVAFSGEPYMVVPLTEDVATIASMLPALTIDIMPVYGDAASPALDMAASLLRRGGAKGGDILLITDGIDDMASAIGKAARLRKAGIRLSVLGIGSTRGAPVPDPNGGGFLTDAAGSPRLARLNAASLRALAAAGGGRYSSLTADDRDIDYLLADQGRHRMSAGKATHRSIERWQEEGAWLVLPLLLLALAGFRRGWLVAFLLLLVWRPAPARAMSWQDLWRRPDQQAARLLAKGQAKKAAALFTDPAWRAVALGRAGDYGGAIKAGRKATDATGLYNLGNNLARAGRLKRALAAYGKSLKLDPSDQDARHNRELIRKLLAQRKKQQQKQQQGKKGGERKNRSGSSGQKRQAGQQKAGQQRKGPGEKGRQASRNGAQANHKSPQHKVRGAGKQGQQPAGRERQGQEKQGRRSKEGAARQQKVQAEQGQERHHRQRHGADIARDLGRHQEARNKRDEPPPGQHMESSVPSSQEDRNQEKPEKDLILEQWLRQVPDDPSGLLRRKFMLEHQRRLQQGRFLNP